MNTTTGTSEAVCLSADRSLTDWNDRESLAKDAAEVAVAWNGAVQDVVNCRTDVEDPWTFTVGEEPGCDFLLPPDAMQGATKLPLVEVRDGVVTVTILPGAGGEVVYGDGTRIPLDSLKEEAATETSNEQAFRLGPNGQMVMEIGPWAFRVRTSQQLEKFSAPVRVNWSSSYFFGLSFVMHAVFFFLVYLIPPNANGLFLDPDSNSNRFSKYILAPPEVRLAVEPEIKQSSVGGGDSAERHNGTEGQAGDRRAPRNRKRFGVKGPRHNKDPHLARPMTKDIVENSGVLGILSAVEAPTSPFGRITSSGTDPENALGSLVGPEIGNSFGFGGLGMKGTGRGGGGDGIGTIGVGCVFCNNKIGNGPGGRGRGWKTGKPDTSLKRQPKSRGPNVRTTPAKIIGSLSKAVIRRHVRRHINEIKFCYEQGLRKRPDISGRVAVRFIISGTGAVQSAAIGNSTLEDPGVESCIAQTVRRMSFPSPEDGGIVVVTYPFTLTSPDN